MKNNDNETMSEMEYIPISKDKTVFNIIGEQMDYIFNSIVGMKEDDHDCKDEKCTHPSHPQI